MADTPLLLSAHVAPAAGPSLPFPHPARRYRYPEKRSIKDEDGHAKGVVGSVELLNARVLSSQPFVGFDWSADKEGLACAVSLDQTARVYIVTKLGKH